jgi:hypothetical protein
MKFKHSDVGFLKALSCLVSVVALFFVFMLVIMINASDSPAEPLFLLLILMLLALIYFVYVSNQKVIRSLEFEKFKTGGFVYVLHLIQGEGDINYIRFQAVVGGKVYTSIITSKCFFWIKQHGGEGGSILKFVESEKDLTVSEKEKGIIPIFSKLHELLPVGFDRADHPSLAKGMGLQSES